MRNFSLYIALFFVIVSVTKQSYAQSDKPFLSGSIKNYPMQPLYLYQCYGDTLLLADSTHTNKKGEFLFFFNHGNHANQKNHGSDNVAGLYKVILHSNQWFYVLAPSPEGEGRGEVEIKTLYQPSPFYNIATDSLRVIKSLENKKFYEFQKKQQQLNVANYFLLQMMRLYPLYDPFHEQIEKEYFARHKAMAQFLKDIFAEDSARGNPSLLGRLGRAYFPVNPDWKQPDPWRDSIIAAHYFDYFNPADSFYLHTNILPEKMDIYLDLRTNKRDNYGQPVFNEMLFAEAAKEFLEKAKTNTVHFDFLLNYFLKKFSKEHKDNAFLFLYDTYLKTAEGDCGTWDDDSLRFGKGSRWAWAREKASILRGLQIGSISPDFTIEEEKLNLHQVKSDYILLLFWATWCPHCTQAVLEIKKVVDNFNQQNEEKLLTVAVSLDTDREQWQKFITENNLLSFLNFSELKGWQSEVAKKYNVYATPTLFLLDKEKRILAIMGNLNELEQELNNLYEEK